MTAAGRVRAERASRHGRRPWERTRPQAAGQASSPRSSILRSTKVALREQRAPIPPAAVPHACRREPTSAGTHLLPQPLVLRSQQPALRGAAAAPPPGRRVSRHGPGAESAARADLPGDQVFATLCGAAAAPAAARRATTGSSRPRTSRFLTSPALSSRTSTTHASPSARPPSSRGRTCGRTSSRRSARRGASRSSASRRRTR